MTDGRGTRAAAARPPRQAITGRALVLGTLVVLLLVLLASPLNRYFGSRSDVQHAAQQLREDQAELAQLRAQQQKWSNPAYIQQQARQRLQYAMPGDVVYVVVRPGQRSDIETTSGVVAQKRPAGWNQKLWQSIQVAGR
ncbi:MAG TPA: septum formation initiator family protein [Jatrophihabitantaceae bacterium]|nr:septum formation initiator family protein [Jatrophihabitantaceae bacterium]